MNKSSSTGNFRINKNNKNNITHLNFKAGEVRINDIFEKSKNTCCYKCGTSNFEESSSITFSCNHISCFKCIIKDLIILQFKNIENKNKLQFNCSCFAGFSPEIDFSEFLQKLKQVNNKKEEGHYCQKHNNIGINTVKNVRYGYVMNALVFILYLIKIILYIIMKQLRNIYVNHILIIIVNIIAYNAMNKFVLYV